MWLSKAREAYNQCDLAASVFYESIAMCLSFNLNFMYNNSKSFPNWPSDGHIKTGRGDKPSNCLMEYVTAELAKYETSDIESDMARLNLKSESKPSITNTTACIENLSNRCASLPKEWSVMQICKLSSDPMPFSNFKRYFTEAAPIKFSALCYARSDKLQNKPLCFHLATDKPNLFKDVHNVYFNLYKATNGSSMSGDLAQKLSSALSHMIENLKLWLGPWIVMFSGKVRGMDGEQFEEAIFQEVDRLGKNHKLNDTQIVWLSQFARRVDLIDSEGIETVAKLLTNSSMARSAIKTYLSSLKLKYYKKFKELNYYPSILVIDELLDTIPWEMLLPTIEMTRFNSIYTLFDLYDEYRTEIVDGYLQRNIQTGHILINPSNDAKLDSMKKRMTSFFTYWKPEWKQTANEVPTDMHSIMSGVDVYVYSGHGSSLQHMDYKSMSSLITKSVMLLFGCESACMSFMGRNSEAVAYHLFMHNSKCPVIIGSLNVVTDLWTDTMLMAIITKWIPSRQRAAWLPEHISDIIGVTERVKKILENALETKESSLLANLSYIRSEQTINIRMRASMICRGLPVINTNK